MKKITILLSIIIILLFSSCDNSKNYEIQTVDDAIFDSTVNQIAIVHPTIENVNHIAFLLENKIIDDDNVNFIGIFNSYENYDYQKVIKLIKEKNIHL